MLLDEVWTLLFVNLEWYADKVVKTIISLCQWNRMFIQSISWLLLSWLPRSLTTHYLRKTPLNLIPVWGTYSRLVSLFKSSNCFHVLSWSFNSCLICSSHTNSLLFGFFSVVVCLNRLGVIDCSHVFEVALDNKHITSSLIRFSWLDIYLICLNWNLLRLEKLLTVLILSILSQCKCLWIVCGT